MDVARTPGGAVGLGLVLLLVLVALAGPLLLRALDLDPADQDLLGRLAPPVWAGGDWAHPLGTNALGEDVLARIVAGARVSLAGRGDRDARRRERSAACSARSPVTPAVGSTGS